ncbi:MAG: DUF1552 domain-containing protein [Opitutales bacterium]
MGTVPTLSRRTMLRGMGAALALPYLEAMTPPARAAASLAAQGQAGSPPLRLCIIETPAGMLPEYWFPEKEGAFEGALPNLLKPFEFARDDLTLLGGLTNEENEVDGEFNGAHEVPTDYWLTAAPKLFKDKRKQKTASVSIDQKIAQKVGDATVLPSLLLANSRRDGAKFSWADERTSVPYSSNPRIVFDRMFRGTQPKLPVWASGKGYNPAAPAQQSHYNPDKSVLDAVLAQAKGLKRRLGIADQAQLDEYMESVRSVEKRIAKLDVKRNQAPGSLDESVRKAREDGLLVPELPGAEGYRVAFDDPEDFGEHIRLNAQLMALAFQTDTTRVGVMAGSGESYPGVVSVGHEVHYHTLAHNGGTSPKRIKDPIAREALREILYFHGQIFAEFIHQLKSIDEGGSSLLDNSLIFYGSELGYGNHDTKEMPVALFGKAKGALKGGQYMRYEDMTPLANMYVEFLNLFGIEADEFGASKEHRFGKKDGRLPGLLG